MTRPVVGVLLVALTVRWWTLLSAVSAGTSESYDATTYYTAAAALLDGRVPYTSEFILVHPPLVVLALVPFALLGALTSAPVGYVAACLAFAAMGAAAAAGVTWLALDWGATRPAAVAGGLVAALGSTAVTSQSLVRLEPLGDLLLVALLLLLGTRARVDRGRLVAAGVVVGLLVNVKLWWFAAVVVLLVLLWRRTSSWRAPLLVAGSGAATAVLLDLPFLLASRGGMLHAVVTTQRGRAPVQGTPLGEFERLPVLARLGQATGVTRAAERFAEPAAVFTSGAVHAVVVLVCLAVALTAVLALRHPLGRLAAPLLLAHVVVLLAVPVYFPFYGDLLVVPAALTLAAAATVLAGRLRVHGLAVAWVSVAVLPLLLAAVASGPLLVGGPPVDDRAAVLGAVGDGVPGRRLAAHPGPARPGRAEPAAGVPQPGRRPGGGARRRTRPAGAGEPRDGQPGLAGGDERLPRFGGRPRPRRPHDPLPAGPGPGRRPAQRAADRDLGPAQRGGQGRCPVSRYPANGTIRSARTRLWSDGTPLFAPFEDQLWTLR